MRKRVCHRMHYTSVCFVLLGPPSKVFSILISLLHDFFDHYKLIDYLISLLH